MLLKIWSLFCTPAVVDTSYFDCAMNSTAWKVKVTNMFLMLIVCCTIPKKITVNYNFFKKMNLIYGLKTPSQKRLDKFFDPYFDVLMRWASHFEKPQKSLWKFYLWFSRYLEKKICILPDLNRFVPQRKTYFISSVGRDFIQWWILYSIPP